MLVNNSVTDNINVGLTFPGEDVKVFSWNWNGKEVEGPAFSATGQRCAMSMASPFVTGSRPVRKQCTACSLLPLPGQPCMLKRSRGSE